MRSDLATAAVLVIFPVLAAVAGATFAAFRRPSPTVASGVQHFAAGVVFAAAALEILPDLRREGHLLAVVVGFALGVAGLIALGALERRSEQPTADTASPALPLGLLVAVGADLLVDGLLVGLGVTLGARQGRILTIALTLEIVFLGLSVAAELAERGTSRLQAAAVPSALSLAVVVGAFLGVAVLGNAPAELLAGALAAAMAALLYLVTEELLTEAHESVTETPFLTALFFIGFLAIYTLEGLS